MKQSREDLQSAQSVIVEPVKRRLLLRNRER